MREIKGVILHLLWFQTLKNPSCLLGVGLQTLKIFYFAPTGPSWIWIHLLWTFAVSSPSLLSPFWFLSSVNQGEKAKEIRVLGSGGAAVGWTELQRLIGESVEGRHRYSAYRLFVIL